jgi:hypothetical protein
LTLPTNTGTFLTSATTTGFPAGSILQVVNSTYAVQTTSSSSAFADTGLTATITPTSASSKILVFANQAGCGKETNNTYLFLRLLRGSTNIADMERLGGFNNTTTVNYFGSCSICYLDSPATTSATTYKTQFASASNNAIIYIQVSSSAIASVSTMTLMEIAA